ncbi:MAG: type II toxin-antitoxin system RelE/ParE family toxin [Candidatus Poribacteria bacterium]|nr:type II toxin-antitoxin system RelE/ParE family toxin [Candidatus Poribacteria bacterium]
MNESIKNVKWVGNSRVQVRNFPKAARKTIGDALNFAQLGYKHPNAKPVKGVGSGVLEITARFDTNTYRAVYTVKLGENIYVLHAFQKKSTRGISTPKKEIDLIKQRLKIALAMEVENE